MARNSVLRLGGLAVLALMSVDAHAAALVQLFDDGPNGPLGSCILQPGLWDVTFERDYASLASLPQAVTASTSVMDGDVTLVIKCDGTAKVSFPSSTVEYSTTTDAMVDGKPIDHKEFRQLHPDHVRGSNRLEVTGRCQPGHQHYGRSARCGRSPGLAVARHQERGAGPEILAVGRRAVGQQVACGRQSKRSGRKPRQQRRQLSAARPAVDLCRRPWPPVGRRAARWRVPYRWRSRRLHHDADQRGADGHVHR